MQSEEKGTPKHPSSAGILCFHCQISKDGRTAEPVSVIINHADGEWFILTFLLYRVNSKKSLTLIQIEERAISELEELYSSKANPDEFITVERCMPTSKLVYANKAVYRSQHSQESPWGKDQVSM